MNSQYISQLKNKNIAPLVCFVLQWVRMSLENTLRSFYVTPGCVGRYQENKTGKLRNVGTH